MFADWRGRQIKKYQSIQDDLLIIEEPNGLLISQDNKTFLARKWKLTDKVIEILNISIKSGFSKLWVDGHPKGETSHYICFSRTHSKPWEFLIGGEANPPNVKCITVNNTHRKVLDDATLGFHWQNFGGKNLFLTPTNEMLSKLIKVIKNIPHGEFKINKNYKSITNSKLNKVGFRNEQELETFIFNQLVYLG